MVETIIGIDLGTTNSEVAVIENGRPVVIAHEGSNILPSFVGVDENGAVLVGQTAKNQYCAFPERTVKSIKRKMGEDTKVLLGASSYSPQEVSAIILKKLKKIAEDHLGRPVHKAVITVPAYFSDSQRQATKEAGEIAGLEVVKIINEPTAASLSYESGHKGGKRILVYDLGGGTFDVSVVEVQEGVIEVVASHGNNQLGGDDFDQKIVEHITDYLKKEHGVDGPLSAQAAARINRAAEAAKITLSNHPFARIEEEYLLEKGGIPVHASFELSRLEYETMISPYIEETLSAVHTALMSAGLASSDIEEILLVGGSTRTPMVIRRLFEEFGMEPRQEVDPDLCVAAGAAIQAGMIAGEEVSAVLVDITPYTFGTSVFGELDGEFGPFLFVPIIKKNTPIPVTKSDAFSTMVDNQEAAEINIYQGENRDARDNVLIGQFVVKGLSSVPAGNTVITMFSLDKNGILHVTAREKATGLEKSVTIDNAISRFEKEEMAAAKARLEALFGEEALVIPGDGSILPADGGKITHHEVVKAKALVEKAQRMLDGASSEDREEIINLIEQITDALTRGDIEALPPSVEELSEILYFLES